MLMMGVLFLSACGAADSEGRDRSLLESILRGPESRAPQAEGPELVPFSNGPTQPPIPLEELQ